MKKMKKACLLLPFSLTSLWGANGFLPISGSVSHNLGVDNSATNPAWNSTQMTFPNSTTWGTGFQEVSFDALVLEGNGGQPLTEVTRTSNITVAGGTFDIAFSATGGFERDPRGMPMGANDASGTSISSFRYDILTSGSVSEISLTNTYTVGWSPFRVDRVWEGLGNINTGAVATMNLFDENNDPIDLSNATWLGGVPSISADGFTATSAAGRDLRISSLGDSNLDDDFIGRVEIVATPASGGTFPSGTQFTYTTNGRTILNAPVVVPEPSHGIFAALSALMFLFCRRR